MINPVNIANHKRGRHRKDSPASSRRIRLLFPILFGILLSACQTDVKWTRAVALPSSGWTPQDCVTFDIDPVAYIPKESHSRFAEETSRAVGDTIPRLKGDFEGIVTLRYSEKCNAGTISIIAERASLRDEITVDTLTFHLFSPDGDPFGRGRFGIYEVSQPLPEIFTVNEGTRLTLTPLPYNPPPRDLNAIVLTLFEPETVKTKSDSDSVAEERYSDIF